jgi:hypothetical protein
MDPPAQLLTFAPPSETALLDFVKARASPEMIHEICLNDWARNVGVHELEIMRQLSPSPELGMLPWHPREVLELERWNEPEEGDADRPPTGTPGHLKRLLACVLLLRNAAFVSPEDSDGDLYSGAFFIDISAATVIRLVRSSIELGSQASRLALGFLLWVHAKQSHPHLRPFVSFAALLLHIQEDLSAADALETCAWVERDEKLAREELDEDDVHSERWMVGLNYQEDMDDAHRELWTATFGQVIAARSGYVSPEVESALRRMYERLLA